MCGQTAAHQNIICDIFGSSHFFLLLKQRRNMKKSQAEKAWLLYRQRLFQIVLTYREPNRAPSSRAGCRNSCSDKAVLCFIRQDSLRYKFVTLIIINILTIVNSKMLLFRLKLPHCVCDFPLPLAFFAAKRGQ